MHVCDLRDRTLRCGSKAGGGVVTPPPGAATSIAPPKFEKLHFWSRWSKAETATTSGKYAGEKFLTVWLALPAAKTTTLPRPCATRAAFSVTGFEGHAVLHPQLWLITSAPFSAA